MILYRRKWLFISTPKCATHTLYKVLQEIGGVRSAGKHPIPEGRMAPVHFTVVRNPYDRMVSIWKFSNTDLNLKMFSRMVADGSYPRRNPILYWSQDKWINKFICDKIIHIENLMEELEEIVGPVGDLPVLNTTEHKHYTEYLTPDIIKNINKWAKSDFKYGYKKLD